MRILYFDIETYSACNLVKVGSYLYARHPTTNIRCLSYCLVTDGGRGPIETWNPGDPVPATIIEFATDPMAIAIAFNDAFDRQIWEQILTPRYGWPVIPLTRHRCAQAAVLARALPASLDAAAVALKIATRKSAKGMAAMKRLAGPRRQSAKERKAGAPLDFSATPEELEVLADYNRADVLMMMEIVDRIDLLSPEEQTLWELDQRINERGIHIDIRLLETALCLEQEGQREVRARIAELTGGVVTTSNQRDRILKWLGERGCEIPNLRKPTVSEALLEPGLNAPARQLLELRQSGAGAAVRKFATLRRWTDGSDEPRIRYAYRYHGGSAGRWTSMGVQVHNLRKPEIDNVREAIAAVATGSLAEMRRCGFARPLETLGQITRAVVSASPGKRLFIADLSGIEARGAAYVCGAQRELEQWRTFDRSGRPEDEPYYQTGIATFAQPAGKARKAGKTGALAFQYQGGVGAYRRVTGDNDTPDEIVAGRRDAWRADHPEYVQFWRLAVFQAVQAIRNPDEDFTAKVVSFRYESSTDFLELTLPSGRKLTYPRAELFVDEQYDSESFTFLDASGSKTGRMYHERKGSGVFGGLTLENIVQAICRDIFAAAMPRLEAAGYAIVAHTHDEWCCEVPEDLGSLEEFLGIVTIPPSWAPVLPIAAKARISDRLIEIPEQVETITDNVITNTLIEDEDEEDTEDTEDEIPELEPIITPKPAPKPVPNKPVPNKPAPICIHCHRDPPDGLERVSAYDGVLLHPSCEEPFIRERMAQEGLAWQSAGFAAAPPPPPPWKGPDKLESRPAVPNGGTGGNGTAGTFTPPPTPSPAPASSSGNGRGNDYPDPGTPEPAATGTFTDTYYYKDAQNRLYMRVQRTTSKNFPTSYWNNGDWVSGWPKEVVPFRLPELLSTEPETLVLIGEGEKDCLTAVAHGFAATTNPGGAKQWQAELAQYFQGKQRVCVMEDHDSDGARHTNLVLTALRGIVPAIGVVRFPELPEHGDLTDFFARGGTKPGLQIRIDEAFKAGVAKPYVVRKVSQIPLLAQRWLWRNHLPIGELELTAGLPGLGKGLLHCDLIARITTGRNWPDGEPGPEPKNVIILTAEDRGLVFRRRLTAVEANLDKIEILESVRRNERDELFLLSEDLDKLEALCLDLGDVGLIEIDPITSFMGHGRGFDSHRATDVRAQLHPLSKLAERLDIALALITHPPKGAASRSVNDNFIGSQAFLAAARASHYCVEELGPEDDRGFRPPTGRILFASHKMNNGTRQPALPYRIEIVPLGWDGDKLIDAGRVVWDPEPVAMSAEEAASANRPTRDDGRKSKAAPVREFLRDILTAGPVLQKIIIERGAEKGFSLDQLKRALKNKTVNGEPFRRPNEGQNSPWWWCLPGQKPPDAITGDGDS